MGMPEKIGGLRTSCCSLEFGTYMTSPVDLTSSVVVREMLLTTHVSGPSITVSPMSKGWTKKTKVMVANLKQKCSHHYLHCQHRQLQTQMRTNMKDIRKHF
eukprot:scaffold150590_cov44-Prasinocladus_malaysianus.AAC.1